MSRRSRRERVSPGGTITSQAGPDPSASAESCTATESAAAAEPVVRPLAAGEHDLFLSLPDPAVVGIQTTGRDYRELLELGQYRPEWSWVALRGDRVVARAAWWGGPDDEQPWALDWFDFGADIEAGVALLKAAPFTAEYCLVLPPRWRETAETRSAGQIRIDAARRAGMSPFVERLQYRWTPGAGVPERSARLTFSAEPDDEAVLAVLTRIVAGSLDAHMRHAVDGRGAAAAARDELDFLRWMPSPREWWRVARTPGGDLVGLIGPGRNHSDPIIGIVGVVPEQRGRGYAFDLLAEATHLLVEYGAESVVATTDVTNTPMAATFARAGYPVIQERVFLHWPS